MHQCLLLGVATNMVSSYQSNGVLHRGDSVVVRAGQRFGNEDGVVVGFTPNDSALVTLDWRGVTYPFQTEQLQATH